MSKISHANFVARYTKHSYDGSTSANKVRAANRRFIYSRYRPSTGFKLLESENILCGAFTPDDQCLIMGSGYRGEVSIFNKYSGINMFAQKRVHRVMLTSLMPHKSGELLLTSGCNDSGDHESALWNIKNNFENQFILNDCEHAEFNYAQDKVLGTLYREAKIYDLHSGQVIQEFKPEIPKIIENIAALNPSDELLLTDGVLYDVRAPRQVHRFDKMNRDMNGIFHTNRLEIISSSEIWDLRTFNLLQTVESLFLLDVMFNNYGDIIFGHDKSATDFRVLDASDYSSIVPELNQPITLLAINSTDTQIVVTEADIPEEEEVEVGTVIRLYDIRMVRHEEESDEEDDDDDEDHEDDEDNDVDDRGSWDLRQPRAVAFRGKLGRGAGSRLGTDRSTTQGELDTNEYHEESDTN